MTALLYFLVAIASAGLSARAWLREPSDPARRAFLGMGISIALTYLSFALGLVSEAEGYRDGYLLAGCLVPVFTAWTVHALVGSREAVPPVVVRLGLAALVVGPGTAFVRRAWFAEVDRFAPPAIVAGAFAFFGFAVAIARLYRAWREARLQVDRLRVGYLLVGLGLAVGFTFVEQLARALSTVDPTGLPLARRALEMQGPIPPLSAIFAILTVYFLYHALLAYRLVDLHELFSRLAALTVSALMLVLVDAIAVQWIDTFTDSPLRSTFQLFVAAVLFLAAYEPLRDHVQWWAARLLNQPGQALTTTLDSLSREVTTVISPSALTELVLTRLHATGRIPACSVYFYEERLGAFARAGTRGSSDTLPLRTLSPQPFVDGFASGEPWLSREALERAGDDPRAQTVLGLLHAMDADLVLPFMAGDAVVGWLAVRDEDWSDGFSADEILRFQEVAEHATIALSNIRAFQALADERRMDAIGTMAVGLAHEIRNPMAGIQGAAEYLQGEDLGPDGQEMLQVIIDEARRLDQVVSRFLDFARPYRPSRRPEHLNALVTHTLTLLQAQGLPEGVRVEQDLAGDLPRAPLDGVRLTQVLLNLMQNGLQAMPDGGVLTVRTGRGALREGPDAVEVVIGDTGAGIAPEHREKLFVPFFTTKERGTGLGLAISRRIVADHGGEIEVRSEPGHGARFVVRLPLT